VHTLECAWFPVKHVSVVTQNLASDKAAHGFITPGDDLTLRGAATGAWVGGLVSVLIGAAFLWVPGFGPLLVVGRLAVLLFAGVEGALTGTATGGLLGALANWGIAEEHILDYEKRLREGKHLVHYGASPFPVPSAAKRPGQPREHLAQRARQLRYAVLVIAYGTGEEVARAHAIMQSTTAGALRAHAGTSV
jgi:hypothetical protein